MLGPVVSAEQFERVTPTCPSASARAPTSLRRRPIRNAGYFVEPTVFGGVSNDMRLAREEIFGPVAALIPFREVDEAVRIANDTDYGLAAAMATSSVSTAHTLARRLRAGVVWVNTYSRARLDLPVRRVQAVRHRPRARRQVAGELHRAQVGVHPALTSSVQSAPPSTAARRQARMRKEVIAVPTNTRAAICWEVGRPWEVVDCVLADPGPGEVLVRLEYAGLCHSDDHNVTGDFPAALPVVGGHEGAGIVVAAGEGVDRVAVGDSVMLLPLPTCGKCRYCADGRTHLCDGNLDVMTGARADGTFAFTTRDGRQVGAYGQLGTFSEYTLVQQIRVLRYERDIPAPVAAVTSCGVITGYGSAVRAAGIRDGETVVVVGTGGVGMSAVMGAAIAGAAQIVAVTRSPSSGSRHSSSAPPTPPRAWRGTAAGLRADPQPDGRLRDHHRRRPATAT